MRVLENIQTIKIGRETAYIIDQRTVNMIEELLMDIEDAKELNKAKSTKRKLAPISKLKKLLKDA